MKWKILFAGDIFIKSSKQRIVSDTLKDLINLHDLKVCNFEGPVKSESGKKIPKTGSYLEQSENSTSLVKNVGFNIISLANNHIYDYGYEGLKKTLEDFKDVLTVGAGENFDKAYQLVVFPLGHLKIGFLSYCEAEFGSLSETKENNAGYAWINHTLVNRIISESKKKVDFLIVQIHAGVEEIELPLPEWRMRYKQVIDLGADIIIGHHPHIPQGWEFYKEKLIFYSLGNFYFDMKSNNPEWNRSFIISLDVENSSIVNYKVIPIFRENEEVYLNNDGTYSEYVNSLQKKLINNDYMQRITEIAVELWNTRYKKYYATAMNGLNSNSFLYSLLRIIYQKLFQKKNEEEKFLLLLHNIRIESHRWIVQRALSYLYEEKINKNSKL